LSDAKTLAKEYMKLYINLVSFAFCPMFGKAAPFVAKRLIETDHQIGILREELTRLNKEQLAEFHRERVRLYHEISSKPCHELLKPVVEAISYWPTEEFYSGEAFLKQMEAIKQKYVKLTTEQRKLAQRIIDTFSDKEIREALTESLKWTSEKELTLAAKAAEKKKVKLKGHESCVFIDWEDEESGLYGTIKVG